MFEQPFYEIVSILVLAAVLGAIGKALRQPLIVAFLAAGILAGPSGFSLIQSHGQIELLAHIGISLLLFVVGLKLDLSLIRTTGPVALATGFGQIIFTSLFGFIIVYFLGFSVTASLYISVALTFSSTIIIVKLLSDKKEIDSLYGRIALGFLIVQDIMAILALILLTALGGDGTAEGATVAKILLIAGKGIGFLLCVGLLMRFVLPWVTERIAGNQELLVLFAISWAVLLGATGSYLGFSKEVGAFLGGVSLASTRYREAIAARLVSVRDFLLLFFFIDLGARLQLTMVSSQVVNATYLSLFVLIGNPLIVIIIMGIMGYRRRTGFMAGLTVAQISEFSLILGALGVSLGHITMEAMSLITLVGVITICMSTYMIIYSGTLYQWLSPALKVFERSHPYREHATSPGCETPEVDFILIGLGNYGSGIAEHLLERKKRVAGVDFDPQVLSAWRSRGLPVIFGDVGDPEFLDNLPLPCSSWVVSTVREKDLSLTLLHLLKERKYEGKIALAAKDEEEAKTFLAAGAHVVLRPFGDAAEEAADSLTEAMHMLTLDPDWPLVLRETRLRKGSVFAGQFIKDLNLRSLAGISIIAVTRAGRVYLDPYPEFQLFPGDRLVLMGEPDTLEQAEDVLQQIEDEGTEEGQKQFATAEVTVAPSLPHCNKSLAELHFRKEFDATVIGIIRNGEKIPMPRPDERLKPGDRLIVIGSPKSIDRIKEVFRLETP
ncbi:MAG: sodium:proton exchanger [Syntrophus sp. (in: bacteria)]|nr:sodium:proton exchanger [Syntrophus sp. (in: bacteria)]